MLADGDELAPLAGAEDKRVAELAALLEAYWSPDGLALDPQELVRPGGAWKEVPTAALTRLPLALKPSPCPSQDEIFHNLATQEHEADRQAINVHLRPVRDPAKDHLLARLHRSEATTPGTYALWASALVLLGFLLQFAALALCAVGVTVRALEGSKHRSRSQHAV